MDDLFNIDTKGDPSILESYNRITSIGKEPEVTNKAVTSEDFISLNPHQNQRGLGETEKTRKVSLYT